MNDMHPGYLLIPILFPILAGLFTYLLPLSKAWMRRIYFIIVIFLNAGFMWMLLFFSPSEGLVLLEFTDTLQLSLRLDGLGKIFAGLVSALWPLTLLYGFDYMKNEKHQRRFWAFFTMAFGVTLGVALAANLLTMYLFYEMLTLVTIPLVIHEMNKESLAAGKKYMIYSFGGAAFAFLGLAYVLSFGASDFVLGGFLSGKAADSQATLFWFFAFVGFGVKAALFPLHGWLPTASVAPTPVTALLHAVAVVKAGAFAAIRLTYYTFGTEGIQGSWAQRAAMTLTLITILYGSVMALRQTHFKRRLAYSTISNLSYVLFGITMLTNTGMIASLLHLVFHSLIKIVAFFAAGAVLQYTGKQKVSSLEGIGRYMPLTFTAFTVSALALTGIPPLNGFFSKWYLSLAALDIGGPLEIAGICVLLISAVLTAIYLITICIQAFFPRNYKALICTPENCREASPLMTVPMLLLSALTVAAGLFAPQIAALFTKVVLG
ncbi:MAG: proton-conducting membrane transporter [Clostridiales bacterium]|nr:proton-conducting membrane transporter [Clostridiales bacterium]